MSADGKQGNLRIRYGLGGIALAAILLGPAASEAQPEATETQARIRLAKGPQNTDSAHWSDWQPVQAEDFPWSPPHAFWQGFIKTSRAGQKAGIFVAILTPFFDMPLDRFDRTAVEDFDRDGAALVGRNELAIAGYAAHNLLFSSPSGNGLYFTGDSTPTTVSLVHVKLEKEKTSRAWPFLVFFLAAPRSTFDSAEAEFEPYVQATGITPVTGSVAGRVVSRATELGVPGAGLELMSASAAQPLRLATDSFGAFRFDSLLKGSYLLSLGEVSGYSGLDVQSKAISLAAGQDTSGLVFELEPVATPVAQKPHPRTEVGVPETTNVRIGIGYRHRLDDAWGIAANARIGNWAPDAALGFDVRQDAFSSRAALFASLGFSYYFLHAGNAHAGLGLIGGGRFATSSLPMVSIQVPLTVEYFLADRVSLQASCGLYVDVWDVNSIVPASPRYSIGPRSALGALGFTWYLD